MSATETRARRRIRKAVESRGYQLVELTWEPWHDAGEKAGIGGGWYGRLDRRHEENAWPGDEVMGLSVDDVLSWIDQFVDPPEPCDCDLPRFVHPGSKPSHQHDRSCRWYLDYWFKWWGDRP